MSRPTYSGAERSTKLQGKNSLTVGTRGSPLALRQTADVVAALQTAHPGLAVETRVIQTQGDRTQAANIPLASFAEKGIFAHELESALLSGAIDFAVHSMKDLAHTLPAGLTIGAVPLRLDPRDALIGTTLSEIACGDAMRIATGSARRRALLASRFPNVTAHEIRGNIDTRLRKLREGGWDAIVLAVAGLTRLGLQDQISERLDPAWFTPDPGQGALAVQARVSDSRTLTLLSILDHPLSHSAISAERAFLRAVGGGCHTPIGALATITDGQITLSAMAADTDGMLYRHSQSAPVEDAVTLGTETARQLFERKNSR